jgi:GntR family transcriptional regulator, transcriptional repressor for pyruvate dehydrogenase complex
VPLRAIHNRSLADQVFEQLAREIVVGRYPPASSLPAERALATVFGVNRHVVREGLKRLEQIGLVKISQGGGTKVLDFKRHAGLDLLALMAEHATGGRDVAKVWVAVLEMRAAIAADIARLCAERGSPRIKEALVAISDEMRRATSAHELLRLEVRFWDRAVEGAQNLAYRLAFNSLIKSAQALGGQAEEWAAAELRANDYRASLARAIAEGDPARAEAETRQAMRKAVMILAGSVQSEAELPAAGENPAPDPVPRLRKPKVSTASKK